MDTTIGFIGTGIMGLPMARNLQKAGRKLFVHTRTRSKAESLLAAGAEWAATPAELAARSETVLSIVPDSPDVRSVYLGSHGVCETVKTGSICVDMSTVDPETAETVRAALQLKGAAFLDAPVSGGRTGAEAGTLTFMVGGDESDLNRVRPHFEVMGKHVVHCGPVGTGQRTKLCNQLLCGLNLLAVCEALTFARQSGLDPRCMIRAVSTGAAASWALQNLGPRMIDRDFAPMFMIDLQQKDLRIALRAATEKSIPLPGTALVAQLLMANQAAGEGREGTQALIKTLERLASDQP